MGAVRRRSGVSLVCPARNRQRRLQGLVYLVHEDSGQAPEPPLDPILVQRDDINAIHYRIKEKAGLLALGRNQVN